MEALGHDRFGNPLYTGDSILIADVSGYSAGALHFAKINTEQDKPSKLKITYYNSSGKLINKSIRNYFNSNVIKVNREFISHTLKVEDIEW